MKASLVALRVERPEQAAKRVNDRVYDHHIVHGQLIHIRRGWIRINGVANDDGSPFCINGTAVSSYEARLSDIQFIAHYEILDRK
jgi:hypothetical protein